MTRDPALAIFVPNRMPDRPECPARTSALEHQLPPVSLAALTAHRFLGATRMDTGSSAWASTFSIG